MTFSSWFALWTVFTIKSNRSYIACNVHVYVCTCLRYIIYNKHVRSVLYVTQIMDQDCLNEENIEETISFLSFSALFSSYLILFLLWTGCGWTVCILFPILFKVVLNVKRNFSPIWEVTWRLAFMWLSESLAYQSG